jgi:hypothetical protein
MTAPLHPGGSSPREKVEGVPAPSQGSSQDMKLGKALRCWCPAACQESVLFTHPLPAAITERVAHLGHPAIGGAERRKREWGERCD